MSRTANLASSTNLLNILQNTQRRLTNFQIQIATEKKSQTYSGISQDSERLVRIENQVTLLNRFKKTNELMDLRLSLTETSLTGIEDTISDFRSLLGTFNAQQQFGEQEIKNIQEAAFRALLNMQTLLNSEADGRFLFSGTRARTRPVDLDLTTLANFQNVFDGSQVTVPTTRNANLQEFTLNQDSAGNASWLFFERDFGGTGGPSRITATTAEFTNVLVGTTITVSGTGSNDGTYTVQAVTGGGTELVVQTAMLTDEVAAAADITTVPTPVDNAVITFDSSVTGGLTFSRANDTITAGTANSLTNIAVGDAIRITATGSNDDLYVVTANDGTTLTVRQKKLTDEGSVGTEVAGTIASTNYYNGDAVTSTHQVNESRSFNFDLNAIDPAFEKAIRGMLIIAQGLYNSNGGLDQNQGRANQALFLLDSSKIQTTTTAGPFGPELASNIRQVQIDAAFQRILLIQSNKTIDDIVGFFDKNSADIENIDPTETIVRLLDDTRALEASFQVLVRTRQLSLLNFIN